ncbi:MAG: LytTR family DNA-binding domain-containing protein [Crocinitomicaceae bacterium]|nr:LytTR family DNA-binding domain-containing protein [Crocinitomicaceae bacterium]
MNVVVVEDQVQLRKSLIHKIESSNLGFNVIGVAAGVNEGIGVILKTKPDIVFFDIEIIEGSSFEILDALPEINFKSIFVTAHGHFAIKAIKYSAFDFLLKPFSDEELFETLVKLKENIGLQDNYKEKFQLLFNELKGKTNKKIAVSSINSIRYIIVGDILRIEASRSYSTIFLASGEEILSSKNMGHYENLLPEGHFIKVHRSHIVNLNFIESISRSEGGFVKLSNGYEVPLSRRKKDDFLKIITAQLGQL